MVRQRAGSPLAAWAARSTPTHALEAGAARVGVTTGGDAVSGAGVTGGPLSRGLVHRAAAAYLLPAGPPRPTPPMRLAPLAPRAAALVLLTALLAAHVPVGPGDALGRVVQGLEEGDPDAVLADVDGRVEVVLFGQGGVFRRAQATHVLRDFFRRYPPSRVSFSEPSSSDDGQTATGRYWSLAGGAPLSVRVMHRGSGDDWELASVRIDQRSAVRPNGR